MQVGTKLDESGRTPSKIRYVYLHYATNIRNTRDKFDPWRESSVIMTECVIMSLYFPAKNLYHQHVRHTHTHTQL